MDTIDAISVRARAKSAYERGRLMRGARESAVALLPAGLALFGGTAPRIVLVTAAVLALVVLGLRSRGELYGRAAFVGMTAGLVPLLLPLLMHRSGFCCIGGMSCSALCLVACLGGGLFAGALVGFRASAGERMPTRFMMAAGLVALIVGSLGCVVSGAAGVVGLAAALAASAVPVAMAFAVARR